MNTHINLLNKENVTVTADMNTIAKPFVSVALFTEGWYVSVFLTIKQAKALKKELEKVN